MSGKHLASEVIVVLQNQFKDKIADNVQRFLSRVDKHKLGDSAMGTASTNLIMSMNRAGNWYAAGLEKAVRREIKEEQLEKKKLKAPRAANPALTRKYIMSDSMAYFLDQPSATRQDVIKHVWAYVKENNLKDTVSGKIRVDDELRKVLGTGVAQDGLIRNTEIMGLISKHFIRPE